MASAVIEQLGTFGPDRCETLSYREAARYARRLARTHYENFSVVSILVPRDLREDFANIYAFCRWADDLGDETGDPKRSLELLEWWRRELEACYAGRPRHPVYVALNQTIRRHDIPIEPFADLIDAFVQDQRLHRYEDWPQVLGYCRRSANPVGRLVLYLCGYRDEQRQQLSDRTCTALQLINFWQDVRRDILERDRLYVPRDVLIRHGLSHGPIIDHARGQCPLGSEDRQRYRQAMRELVDRTMPLFQEGRELWPLVTPRVRLPIRLFTLGGLAVARAIVAQGYDTLDVRPRVSRALKLRLMMQVIVGKIAGGWR